MPKNREPVLQRSFSSGQIDANVLGRSDAAVYDTALSTCRNFLPFAAGSMRPRPGSEIKRTFTAARRLAGFKFSRDQTYVFAFSNTQVEICNGLTGAAVATLTGAPWLTAILCEMRIVQRGDTMIVVHSDFWPQIIKRTGASTFTLTDFAFETESGGWPRKEPFYRFEDPAITIAASATTGTITVTASSAMFTTDHVGTILRKNSKQIELTVYLGTTTMTGVVRETLTGTGATTDWDESVVSVAHGYPRSVTFHGQRLVFGGTTDLPLHVMTSQSSAFFNFDTGTAQANEAVFVPVAGNVATIYDVVSMATLVVITDSGVFHFPENASNRLTPGTADPKAINREGGFACAQAIGYEDMTLYPSLPGSVISSLKYNELQQGYEWSTASLLYRDFPTAFKQTAVVEKCFGSIESYAVFLDDTGNMSFYHAIGDEKMQGWFPYTTTGTVHGIAGIDERLWLCVERTVNAASVFTLELMDEDFTLDGAERITIGAPGYVFPGFTYLTSETVDVVASAVDADANTVTNAFSIGQWPVSAGGEIDITTRELDCTILTAGFKPPTPTAIMLPVVVRTTEGEWVGTPRKVARTILQVNSALTVMVEDERLILLQVDDDFSLATMPSTDSHEFRQLGWGTNGVITIVVDEPLPCELLSVLREVVF